jgi:chromosome segregation ATPase
VSDHTHVFCPGCREDSDRLAAERAARQAAERERDNTQTELEHWEQEIPRCTKLTESMADELAAERTARKAADEERDDWRSAYGDLVSVRSSLGDEALALAQQVGEQRDAALVQLAARDQQIAALRAFVEHHDNGQTGQPGFPRTYGELEIWQAEWDRRYEALRALLAPPAIGDQQQPGDAARREGE